MILFCKDEHLNELINEFYNNTKYYYSYAYKQLLKKSLCDITLTSFTWDYITSCTFKEMKVLVTFMYFLHDKGLFNYEGIDYCREHIERYFFLCKKEYQERKKNITPYSFFYIKNPNSGKYKRLMINGIDKTTRDFFLKYLDYSDTNISDFDTIDCFEKILSYKTNLDFDCFNDKTFYEDFQKMQDFKKEINRDRPIYKRSLMSHLSNFYIYIQNHLPEEKRNVLFKIYTPEVLRYKNTEQYILDGYSIIQYSPYEKVPAEDKWLIKISKPLAKGERKEIQGIDFSKINNITLRSYVKEYFWITKTNISLSDRIRKVYRVFDFCNYLWMKYGDSKKVIITLQDVLGYKNIIISTENNDSTNSEKLSQIRQFIEFLFTTDKQVTNQVLIDVLFFREQDSNAYKECYSKQELSKLLTQLRNDYENEPNEITKKRYHLDYYLTLLLSLTEIRLTNLLNLETDCLVKTLSRTGADEYKIVCQSKTSKGEYVEYNITRYVKSIIDEVKNITEESRANAASDVKRLLFIAPRLQYKTVDRLAESTIRLHLQKACEKVGIPYKPFAAVRNYYQNEVSKFVEDNNLGDLQLQALSGHTKAIHENHYVNHDIKDLCQALYGVKIGDMQLKGNISPYAEIQKQDTVKNGCGGCTSSKCDFTSNLDCLMCSKFITTLSCIPYFEQEIAKIDNTISSINIKHEQEFLVSKKKLLVAYLERLYQLKEDNIGSIN